MSISVIALITTLFLGFFILLGAYISFLISNNDKIVEFSIGLAFGVIITLIFTDLLPEIYESLIIWKMLIGIIIGYGILRLLDHFIPDHDENKLTKKELSNNLVHIGIITSIALTIHNIIEGMAVYSTIITSNTSLGIAMTIGIGCHNIPLGMVIASSLYQSNKSKLKSILILILVSISTFIGGLILFVFNQTMINETILAFFLSITLGMLLFIIFNELLPRIVNTKKKKTTYIGIVIGVLILTITLFI